MQNETLGGQTVCSADHHRKDSGCTRCPSPSTPRTRAHCFFIQSRDSAPPMLCSSQMSINVKRKISETRETSVNALEKGETTMAR